MFLTIVINIDPNLFQIGPLLITWHGVFSVLGILAAARLGLWLLGKDNIDVSRGPDGVTWMVLLGLVGARGLYVWENFKLFSRQLLHIFYITEGGISQWGGLFGAILGAYVWARRAHFSFWKVIDAGGPAAMIGLAVGRIGDVINGEHHGTPTNQPWGVEYVNPSTLGHQRLKAKLPDGVAGLIYLGLYGVGRFWLSYFRTDPAILYGLRQAQVASLLMSVVAAVAIPILIRLARAPRPAVTAAPMESIQPEAVAVSTEPVEVTQQADGESGRLRRRRRRRRKAAESARAIEPTEPNEPNEPAEAFEPEEAQAT